MLPVNLFDDRGQVTRGNTTQGLLGVYHEPLRHDNLPGKTDLVMSVIPAPGNKPGKMITIYFRTDQEEQDYLGTRGGYLLPEIMNRQLETVRGNDQVIEWQTIPGGDGVGTGIVSKAPVQINLNMLALWLVQAFSQYDNIREDSRNDTAAQNKFRAWLRESRETLG